MEFVVLFVMFVAAAIIFTKSMIDVRREKREYQVLLVDRFPDNLGARREFPLKNVVDQLEASLDDHYIEEVKQRLIDKGLIKEEEFQSYFFELKRFFVLAAILKHTPMYNEKIDMIWHEMIMFTKEYKQFCESFTGEMIHHSPNTVQTPDPEERAWFEWVYTQLFQLLPYTDLMYGRFFSRPMSKKMLRDFGNESESQLRNTYFRETDADQISHVQDALIKELQQCVSNAETSKPDRKEYVRAKTEEDVTMLAYIMLYFSLTSEDADEYQINLDTLEADAAGKPPSHGSGFFGGGDSSDGGASCGAGCGGGT